MIKSTVSITIQNIVVNGVVINKKPVKRHMLRFRLLGSSGKLGDRNWNNQICYLETNKALPVKRSRDRHRSGLLVFLRRNKVPITRTKRLVSFPIKLDQDLKVAADQQNKSVSAFLTEAVIVALNKAGSPAA